MFNEQLRQHNDQLFEISRKIKYEKMYEKKKKKNLIDEISTQSRNKDMGQDFYEPFDEQQCENKLKIDSLYYQQLMENLDEEYTPQVENKLIKLFKTVREIYEFVNIKPEFFGKNIDETILQESSPEINRVLSKRIYETLDSLFYKLSPEQRKEKYREISEHFIKELINEGIEPEQAIQYGVKASVMENLLTKISFPFTCWSRVKYLTESHDYGLVFDQEQLVELVESFEKQVHKLSRIVATCV